MKTWTLTTTLLALAAVTVMAQREEVPLVYDVENTGCSFPRPEMPDADALPIVRELPDALEGVGSFADWARRRSDIGHMIQHYGIGTKPAVTPQQIVAHMEGDTALVVDVTVGGETLTLRSVIHYPKVGQPPYALMIGTSMMALPRQLFADRPIAIMNYHEKQVNDYGQWGPHHERGQHPFDRLYPALTDNGAYSEWAWGLSRIIDGLQQLGTEATKIDIHHIGVTGCSYAGKMALYCGAFDERIALTIAQEPGGGGAAAWRKSHESEENVEDINKTDYHWFLESQREHFSGDSVYRLPYDQHELCAMVCPRQPRLPLAFRPRHAGIRRGCPQGVATLRHQRPNGLQHRRRSRPLPATTEPVAFSAILYRPLPLRAAIATRGRARKNSSKFGSSLT